MTVFRLVDRLVTFHLMKSELSRLAASETASIIEPGDLDEISN